ncbi:biotin carboxylase [Dasania sp. GY-MA-18]|uniref:Biotin carboxylase n=1 Tax=Dasania phycosphaerae TaxID=2950436 RepID=A0A9J6RNP2_9GAMM|nr:MULTISPECIES: biotin/lipoyl-containing protein [Dasania]MCR8923368.1 biotin carboxylase [Dasania sp. GY-MA-18]MCZ0865800.1 biotin carboxylase [Dasania phycosphaerae]MCZ0869525.1 biotin carboxylase [Dasania phycosphaerae]
MTIMNKRLTTVQHSNDYYLNNPLIHQQRQLKNHPSAWVQSFHCEDIKPLIICRGPIRKEAMDVFDEMGINNYGILLSEKDSITYTNALAPELRKLTDPSRVHRVPDYTGATKEERAARIQQIISIAKANAYDAIFAGYGFMSEDAEMVEAMEQAGLNFIGPGSHTQRAAGMKDQAKRTALETGVSVTPGVNNATSLALFAKYGREGLETCAKEHKLTVDFTACKDDEEKALALLAASYRAGIDIITAADIGAALQVEAKRMLAEKPNNRFRLKAIAGGGGKGQRILKSANSYTGASLEEKVEKAAAKVPALVLECLIELKTNGVGDNKNVLIEMNIDTTRHQEIQVVGNGDWCMTMGGRDCSLQMHEQKLLEVSVTEEELQTAIATAEAANKTAEVQQLKKDLDILRKMEHEGAVFGAAVKLNSVGTFECIVDGEAHYFMEMNTRIQVEHRVTELCYKLKFSNPENPQDFFIAESLVEVMVLIARHGNRLPKPERLPREPASVEARLNATNQALQPHAGGMIERWSNPIAGEIRDDQGISMHNPDTDVFMKYHLAGAYDSNIALLLTTGNSRLDSYQRLAEVLRRTTLRGKDLATNLEFHYGLVNWFIGNNINARPSTNFIVPYLTAVGQLKEAANQIDLNYAYGQIRNNYLNDCEASHKAGFDQALDRKQGLLLRPLQHFVEQPHNLSGWLSINQQHFSFNEQGLVWHKNPIALLADIYHYLHMDYVAGKPAANMIWCHDNELLQKALSFYNSLEQRLGVNSFAELEAALAGDKPDSMEQSQWQAVIAAHAGFQAGTEILAILPYLAKQTGFYELSVNEDLSIHIPAALTDGELQAAMAKVLVPPPVASSDEILAASGGMFYPREAPGMQPFVEVGSHFNEGDPLYIVEVMKMFNKVYAPFSGTIDAIFVETDGSIIKKGQKLFKITPDEVVVVETPEQVQQRMREHTNAFLLSL